MKQNLMNEFISIGCLSMWDTIHDESFYSIDMVINNCQQRVSKLRKCDDLTILEKCFINLIDSWE